MIKLANLLRRWAERLDPTPKPAPTVQLDGRTLRKFRLKYEVSRRELDERFERYRGQLSQERFIEIVRQEIIVKSAVDLASALEMEEQPDRFIFTAQIYAK